MTMPCSRWQGIALMIVCAAVMATARTASSEPVPAAPLCFRIERIELSGLRPELAFLQHDANRFRGRCIGVAGLNAIVRTLQSSLLAHGYVTTRVRLPQQSLASGVLRLTVTPGVIHEIRLSKRAHTTWANAYPTRAGALLNDRDLEQGLDQMQRVPSQDVHMAIAPATTPGASDVIVDVEQQRQWRIVLDANNAGSEQTGRVGGAVTVDVDNLLGANDLFHVGLNTSIQGGIAGGSRGDNVYYSVPEGYWTLDFNATDFSYSQTVAGYENSYTLSGKQRSASFSLERMLYRSQQVKTWLTLSLTTASIHSYLDGVEIDVQRRNESTAELALERAWSNGHSSLDVSAGVRVGLPILGATPDPMGIGQLPTTRYQMGVVSANASIRVPGTRIMWQPQLSAQVTANMLYPTDAFAIGNRYTVRGFNGSTSLTAESGYFVRNDLVAPGPALHQLYLGLDTGCVWGPDAQFLAGKSLAGIALGVRGAYRSMKYDVFSGVPITAPAQFAQSAPAVAFDVQVAL